MSRRLLIDVICAPCRRVLARELEDGSWQVKIAERTGDRWQTISEWQERFVCPDCKTPGYVEVTDMIRAGFKNSRRVRVPIRPLV
jgi:hypothetical protein